MPNTSATGGYLQPTVSAPPLEDADLDAEFQKAVVGITGLPGNLVRPRWQPGNPKQPEPTVDWCAIGVMTQTPDGRPYLEHNPAGEGSDILIRHEQIKVLCTFYGPHAKGNASKIRDGVYIQQNLDMLSLVNISLVESGDIQAASEIVNMQWVKRYDLPLTFARQIIREYAALNILSANPLLISDEIGTITT